MEYIVTVKSGPQGKCCCYYCRVRGSLTEKVSTMESKLPKDLKVYTMCLKSLDIVKKRCFDNVADPSYLASIQDFKNTYLEVRSMTMTPVIWPPLRTLRTPTSRWEA